MTAPIWTDAEKATLRRHYPTMGRACHVLIPGRTAVAVMNEAASLGLRKPGRAATKSDNPSLTRVAFLLGYHVDTVRRRVVALGISPTKEGMALTLNARQFERLSADLEARPMNRRTPPAPDWRPKLERALAKGERCELSAGTVKALVAELRKAGLLPGLLREVG